MVNVSVGGNRSGGLIEAVADTVGQNYVKRIATPWVPTDFTNFCPTV
jgi:hypothetical protein